MRLLADIVFVQLQRLLKPSLMFPLFLRNPSRFLANEGQSHHSYFNLLSLYGAAALHRTTLRGEGNIRHRAEERARSERQTLLLKHW